MNVHIRRVAPGDGPLLREVRLTALVVNPTAFASTHAAEVDQTDETWETWAASASTGRDQAVFVAELHGRFVGLSGAFRMDGAPTKYHLFAMWTDPQHRREGYGAALTEAVIAWAEESGGARISLWVVDGNRSALRMYERLGFRPTGATQALPHREKLTELEMERHLNVISHPRVDEVPAGYVEFAPMTRDEFERYIPDRIERYAGDLARVDDLSAGAAIERAATEFTQLLPQRESTPFHHVCALRAGLELDPVGAIWFASSVVEGRAITFIYDLVVAPANRRRGIASAALGELEQWCRLQDHRGIATRLFEHDAATRRLFERNGFQVIEATVGYVNMEKPLGLNGQSM